VGELLLDEGLVTREQLDAALGAQEANPGTLLGQVLVEQGVLTQRQLRDVLDKYKKKYRLGDLLVETNAITEEQLETALQEQRSTGLRLGDVLVQLNYLSELELKRALCTQLRIGMVDLDAVDADAGLTGLVDARYAREHRVIPIGRAGNRLSLAMEDPTDSAVIDSLEAATGLTIEVVTAPAAAFDRALGRLYGPAAAAPPAAAPDPAATPDPAPAPESAPPVADSAVALLEARYADVVRQLTALQAAHERLSREREASVRARGDLETRYAETAGQLTELRTRYAALAAEHTAATRALRDLREQYRALERRRAKSADPLPEILRGLRP
jgi:hypothetical protein